VTKKLKSQSMCKHIDRHHHYHDIFVLPMKLRLLHFCKGAEWLFNVKNNSLFIFLTLLLPGTVLLFWHKQNYFYTK